MWAYGVDSCAPNAWSLFNSGLMLLSQSTHAPLVAGWTRWQLTCRVLCDQLFFNAAPRARLRALPTSARTNYVGSELRRALVRAGDGRPAAADAARRRAALRDACVLHLTRKVPKLYLRTGWSTVRLRGVTSYGARETQPLRPAAMTT